MDVFMDNGFGNWPSLHRLRNPRRIALLDGETGLGLSYEELDLRTNALADVLRGMGVAKGDRVALVTLNSPHMLEVLCAVAKLGAISVPVNYRLSPPEIRFILEDSGAEIVFTSTQTSETVRDAVAGTPVREQIEIPSAAQRKDSVSSTYENMVSAGDTDRVEEDIDRDDLGMLMYTSGTTGPPKGAMLTHDNILWNAINNFTLAGEGLTPRDINLAAAPLFHIGALGIFTLPLLYAGGTTVIMESFAPEQWLDAVDRYRPTLAFCVPAMWAALDVSPTIDRRDLGSLRYVLSGGAPCPIVLIDAMRERGLTFVEGFGLTETAPFVAALNGDEVVDHAGSIGKPVVHVDLRIVNEMDEDVDPGETGELAIRGPNVFAGYWNNAEATEDVLKDGWFLSGDLARRDDEGYYSIVDRKKDMIISGGENVYATEVEQVLYQNPDVAEVAVIGRPDPRWGESVAAVVVCTPGADIKAEELISWTRQRLAAFKCPRTVVFLDALPRTATGKVIKRDLRKSWTDDGTAVQR
nr:long-chain fatty acid--CoA ligase [Dietzia maris]